MAQKTGNDAWQAISGRENTTTDAFRRATYTEDGLRRLAAAVVTDAVEEYRYYGKKIKKVRYKMDAIKSRKEKAQCLKTIETYEQIMLVDRLFFKSDKFKNLCDIDNEWLLKTLDAQIEAYNPEDDESDDSEEEKKEAE